MPCQLYSNIFGIVLYWWFQLPDMPPNPRNSGNLYWYAVEPCRQVLLLDWEAWQATQWFMLIYIQGIWSTMAMSCLRRLYFFSTLCVFAVSSGLKARNMYLKAMVMSCYIARYSKLSNTFQDVQICSHTPQKSSATPSLFWLPSTGELWRSSHIAFLHGGSTKRWGWAEMDGTGRVVTTKQMQI